MINKNFELDLVCYMSLEIDYSETDHTTSTNELVIKNKNVYQQITYTKDIMSEKQLEHLIHKLITIDGFLPEINGSIIIFRNNKNEEKYIIDKQEMKIIKEKNILVGPLENM